ncbi:nucleotide sugar dehydrogenase [Enterococcus villorum]|uniref:nucleotide sugar dehydrogenase n=1 Tax=Enterococcus villorum TaxID=112904 RepID=UPI003F894C09
MLTITEELKEIYLNKIETKNLRVGVIGMGYVGLPLAVEFAKYGLKVVGIDLNEQKVSSLNQGKSHILDVPDYEVNQLVENRNLLATSDFSIISELDALSICVPTPLNENQEPDTSYIEATVKEIVRYQEKPLLVVLESTTYPGTTRELIAGTFEKNGLVLDQDYYLCFSPERVDPGNKNYQTKQIPKVIGGLSENSTHIGQALYEKVIDAVVPVSSPETAEMSKLLENTFRSVNIAFVNEMALMCDRMGIDIWETIDAAATKPFGYMPFYPGPGVGGHCIPLDPMYLYWKGKKDRFFNQFIELSQRINLNMPYYVVDKTIGALDTINKNLSDAKVLIVGLSYKDNIDDIRESPALDIYDLLMDAGAQVEVLDPFVTKFKDKSGQLVFVNQNAEEIDYQAYDVALILAKHQGIDYQRLLKESHAIVDMKHIYQQKNEKIFKIGG